MIKKITAIALLSAVLFSCSTSNEVVSNGFLQKRKYNKGWHANKSSKLKDSKKENSKEIYEAEEVAQNEVTQAITVQQEIKSVSREYISKKDVAVKSERIILALNNNKEEAIVSTSKIIVQEQDAVVLENLKRVSETKPVEIKEISSKNAGDAGVALLLLVILAILLPPLAVFLVNGIDQTFWISVILTLLFWLPGIIYAMLIIFGMI